MTRIKLEDLKLLTYKQAAEKKGCSVMTIRNNLHKFTVNSGRIVDDAKFTLWQPDRTRGRRAK